MVFKRIFSKEKSVFQSRSMVHKKRRRQANYGIYAEQYGKKEIAGNTKGCFSYILFLSKCNEFDCI